MCAQPLVLDRCDEFCVHPRMVAEASAAMPPAPIANAMAELFKALGDPTRARILCALGAGGGLRELCVCDLSMLLDMSPSAVSHQLRVLRSARLVRARRDGKMAYYALDDGHVSGLLALALDHVREERS